MNRIIKILMERDGITEAEAREMYDNCQSELVDAIADTSCLTVADVFACELGLEMEDYLIDMF